MTEEQKRKLDSRIKVATDLADKLTEKASQNPTYTGLIHQLDRLTIILKKLLKGEDNNESKQ